MTLLAVVLGFAEGIAVGAGLVALLTVLDIIPRLVHLTGINDRVRSLERAIIAGGILAALFDGFDGGLGLAPWIMILVGLAMGIFVGLFAGALTEVLNVLPVLGRRLSLQDSLRVLLLAFILGKTAGSLLYWLYPRVWEP
ncbi:MAG: stage V sporulation protein AB [Limnochordia bacterium]|jgi:stage V sporulation protein AB|nr:stage V sporulation protein AB [Bacillota bacterium]